MATQINPTPKTVLVYIDSTKDNALGENIRKLPFVWALRKAYPDAKISWVPGVGPAQFEGILMPLVDGAIDELITTMDLPDGPSRFLVSSALAGRHFDLIIDTQKNIWRTLALKRISHDRFISAFWRYHPIISDGKPPAGVSRGRHMVDQLLALVSAAKGSVVAPVIPLPLPSDRLDWAARILPDGENYIGIAPGAGRQDTGKCWPLQNFIALAKDQQEKGRTVLFILGPEEASWRADIDQKLPSCRYPLDELKAQGGPTDPAMTMALGSRLDVGIANCSGTGHMLAGGGASLVSIFGPTNPAKQAPFGSRVTTIRAQDFGSDDIKAIPVAVISQAVNALVDNASDY